MIRKCAFALLAAAALSFAAAPLRAEEYLELKWRDLVPKNVAPATKPKTFFQGSTPADDSGEPPQPLPEGKFMQMKRRQPGAGRPPLLVPELNGKTVRLGGYVVPLDFEATTVKEFLLVPFIGACIHVPPPPANQIVYVKVDQGFEVADTFAPVTVTGTIKTDLAVTGLADAGYTMDATSVVPRTE